jgi:hypothetical protein
MDDLLNRIDISKCAIKYDRQIRNETINEIKWLFFNENSINCNTIVFNKKTNIYTTNNYQYELLKDLHYYEFLKSCNDCKITNVCTCGDYYYHLIESNNPIHICVAFFGIYPKNI